MDSETYTRRTLPDASMISSLPEAQMVDCRRGPDRHGLNESSRLGAWTKGHSPPNNKAVENSGVQLMSREIRTKLCPFQPHGNRVGQQASPLGRVINKHRQLLARLDRRNIVMRLGVNWHSFRHRTKKGSRLASIVIPTTPLLR